MARSIHRGNRPPPDPAAGALWMDGRGDLYIFHPEDAASPWHRATVNLINEPTKQQPTHSNREMTVSEYDDYAKALIAAIDEGRLDSHLKPIATAAFNRAKLIGAAKKPDQSTAAAVASTWFTTNEAGEALIIDAVPACKSDVTGVDMRTVFGRNYRRSDFMDKWFKIKPGTYATDEWDWQPVKITGMSDERFKVDFRDPNIRKPGGQAVTFIRFTSLQYLFGPVPQ